MDNAERLEINADDSLHEIIIKASEDNPSAVMVLMKMLRKLSYGAFSIILQMDDMNIRGAQIFVGYKFHCRSDLDLFIGCIENRDRKMLEAINNEGRKGRYPHKAVAGGAVEGRREILTNDSHGVA